MYSAFHHTELASWLHQCKAQKIVLCGVDANVCVQQTAFDAFAANFRVLVVSDAVHAEHEGQTAGSLETIRQAVGDVVTTAYVERFTGVAFPNAVFSLYAAAAAKAKACHLVARFHRPHNGERSLLVEVDEANVQRARHRADRDVLGQRRGNLRVDALLREVPRLDLAFFVFFVVVTDILHLSGYGPIAAERPPCRACCRGG